MKTIFKFFALNLLILSVLACGTTKPVVDNSPQWVKARPQNSAYYIGIGSASKIGVQPADYTATAQKKALADMASEISTNIESSSVLSTIESNYNVSQTFSNDIITSTSEQLEGYELVDSWQDENYYWVYYKLSKAAYKRIKQERKQRVLTEANKLYEQANSLKVNKLHFNAFKLYINALTTLKPYLAESTLLTVDGVEKDVGTQIFHAITDFITGLHVVGRDGLVLKKGLHIPPSALTFTLCDADNQPVANMPVKIAFSATGLLKNSEQTDNNGTFVCEIDKLKTEADHEELTLSVDINALTRIATDMTIKKVVKNITPTTTKVGISVQKPSLLVKVNANQAAVDIVYNAWVNALTSSFAIADKRSADTDFALTIDISTKPNGQYYGEYQSKLSYTLVLSDKAGDVVYKNNNSFSSPGESYAAANDIAYDRLVGTIERYLGKEVLNAINK